MKEEGYKRNERGRLRKIRKKTGRIQNTRKRGRDTEKMKNMGC